MKWKKGFSKRRRGGTVNCCCNWGAARSGEYPEFGCAKCPVHEAALGETELCKKHNRDDFAT